MSHLFSKKFKAGTDEKSELPLPPKTEQVIADLEAAKPDDVVFTTDIGLVDVEDVVHQDLNRATFALTRRFQQKQHIEAGFLEHGSSEKVVSGSITTEDQEQDNLYEKVIEYNQNVEKLVNLHQSLPKVLENLSHLNKEIEEDRNCVTDTYKEALKLYQEVNAEEIGSQ